jgi:hypothetical protein
VLEWKNSNGGCSYDYDNYTFREYWAAGLEFSGNVDNYEVLNGLVLL